MAVLLEGRGPAAAGRPEPSGGEKAAILLVALGQDFAARVLRILQEEEVEQLTLHLASVRPVDADTRAAVLEECRTLLLAEVAPGVGGVPYARAVLEKALGAERAAGVLGRLTSALEIRPFEFARQSDPGQVARFLHGEHPQTIALVLAHLRPEQACTVLGDLDPAVQVDVVRRLARLSTTSPEVVREVERVLERRFAGLADAARDRAGGLEMAADVLNRVGRAAEKSILGALGVEQPDLAQELRRRMFVFDDLVTLDDRSLQRALREVDFAQDLPRALKVATPNVRAKVLQNISAHQREQVTEALEFLGPVRLRDVEDAQQRIIAVIRRLEDAGEVVIARGAADALIP